MRDRSWSPPAPLLREIRDQWLDNATAILQASEGVVGAALVGSLGRGDADDWSDVDLLIVVDDEVQDRYAEAAQLPSSDLVSLSFDARHNAPAGTRAVSAQYIIRRLPLWVDWYIYPRSHAGWASDSRVVFANASIARLDITFEEHLATRQVQEATNTSPDAHWLLQLALVPVAGKRIARRSPDAAHMIEFLGGHCCPDASPQGHVAALQAVLDTYERVGPEASVAAANSYLDLVAATL